MFDRAQLLNPEITALQAARVKPRSQDIYLRLLELLGAWLKHPTLPSWTTEEWDVVIPDYIQYLFDSEGQQATATRTVSALFWLIPGLRQKPPFGLPHSQAALAGWRKLVPGHSRPPLPRDAMLFLADRLYKMGRAEAALCILLMFETYLRSNDMLSLRCQQVVAPPAGSSGKLGYLSILAAMEEYGVTSKTGEFDLSIPLDLPRHRDLAHVLLNLVRGRSDHQMVWSYDYPTLRRWYNEAMANTPVAKLSPTLHSLRHGGASHDRASGSRSMSEVMARGHWRALTSGTRYNKPARINQQLVC